jgi:SAM-dependent methyltransferase
LRNWSARLTAQKLLPCRAVVIRPFGRGTRKPGTVSRMGGDHWWQEFDAVLAASLPAGARVLDLGCGDGGLVDRMAELGFDALGVDPRAPDHLRLIRQRIEQVVGLGEFDAITAVMALHHADLDAVVPAIGRLLRPRGRLFMYDFGWDCYDDRAAKWLASHDRSDADNSIAGLRREHGKFHTIPTITQALSARFEPTIHVPRPYLARMLARPDLEAEEHALIDAQLLPPLGLWYIAGNAR